MPAHFSTITASNMASFRFENFLRRADHIDVSYEFNECFGTSTGPTSAGIALEKKQSILKRCMDFMIELALQIRQRLPDSVDSLELLRVFEPTSALSVEEQNIRPLLRLFFHVEGDIESAISEYNVLRKREWSSAKLNDPEAFWTEVFLTEGQVPHGNFCNISKFALAILSIPFSNASVERVFSTMSIVKSKLRNRMQCKMVDAILNLRYGLIWRGEACKNMTVSQRMLSKFNVNIYNDHNEDFDECIDVDIVFEALRTE